MSGGYSGKFWQRQSKIQLFKDNLGEQPKIQILATIVQTTWCNGFIRNLPFSATRLECMTYLEVAQHLKFNASIL